MIVGLKCKSVENINERGFSEVPCVKIAASILVDRSVCNQFSALNAQFSKPRARFHGHACTLAKCENSSSARPWTLVTWRERKVWEEIFRQFACNISTIFVISNRCRCRRAEESAQTYRKRSESRPSKRLTGHFGGELLVGKAKGSPMSRPMMIRFHLVVCTFETRVKALQRPQAAHLKHSYNPKNYFLLSFDYCNQTWHFFAPQNGKICDPPFQSVRCSERFKKPVSKNNLPQAPLSIRLVQNRFLLGTDRLRCLLLS